LLLLPTNYQRLKLKWQIQNIEVIDDFPAAAAGGVAGYYRGAGEAEGLRGTQQIGLTPQVRPT